MNIFFKILIFLFFTISSHLLVNAQQFGGPPPQGMPPQGQGMSQQSQNPDMAPLTQGSYSREDLDYAQIYDSLSMVTFKYEHDIDPYQQEDYKDYTWSPYPLMRITTPLYFKKIVIPVGYYLLTPRTVEGRDVVTFKTSGKVVFTIPTFQKVTLPLDYYTKQQKVMPKPKIPFYKKPIVWVKTWFYKKTAKNAMRLDPPKSRVETNPLDGDYYEMDFYYDLNIYRLIFRTSAD